MRHIFLSSPGQLKARWEAAFPAAEVASELGNIPTMGSESQAIIWLDTSNISGSELAEKIKSAIALGKPLVVMSSTPSESQAFQALNAGCAGYCHVNAAHEQLREIALVVEHGGLWMPPELVQRLLALSLRTTPVDAQAIDPQLNELTARELMVADQVAHGATNREIAQSLEITERTVKAHLSSIFGKMGVRDRVQLALAMNNIPIHTTVN